MITPDGNGPVTDLNIVKETVFVRLTNGDTSEIREYPLDEITRQQDIHPQQEAGRKTASREAARESAEEKDEEKETGIEDSGLPDINQIQREPSESQNNTPVSKPKESNRNRRRKAVLGQPVKRENPNRTVQPPAVLQDETPKEIPKQAEVSSAPAAPKNNWADALEKAMQAIGQDK